jgi:hypothetical protein
LLVALLPLLIFLLMAAMSSFLSPSLLSVSFTAALVVELAAVVEEGFI